jgi:hypothetical protein
MAGRIRTTKTLAQRINLDYFKKTFPIPFWRKALWIGLTAVGLLWTGYEFFGGRQAYNAGPLSRGHKIITNNCVSCHATPAAFFGTKVTDTTCKNCHDAPVHQARETFTPQCTACHVEHQDSFKLAATTEASCTQCHADLKVKDGKTNFATGIKSLSSGHPEFAAVRPGHPDDPGNLKLNHKVHLKKDLRGPDGKPVQMVCVNCHQEATPQPRPDPVTGKFVPVMLVSASMSNISPSRMRSMSPEIAPTNFEQHCMSCHPLVFDKRFKDPAPHKETAVVEAYVIKTYTDYIAAHPNEVFEPVKLNPDLPMRPQPPAPRNAQEWIAQRVEEADRLLWQKSCKECHTLTYPAPSVRPEVPKVNQTMQWMKNSWFDHKPHQLVACEQCHTDAPNSEKTADVLLPKVATCQKCHFEGKKAAEVSCFECHAYHDWSKAKQVNSTNTISMVGK